MSFSLGIFTFINVWWITLFLVLPFSIKMEDSKPGIGYIAAPKNLRWRKVLTINTSISLLVTIILALLIHIGAVSLRI